MSLQFYNSLSRQVEPFTPLVANQAKLYTCGPTVYNFAHIGNFRAYMFEDLLRRALKYCGCRVCQVMNLTDVDDKTIRGSRQAGIPLNDFTRSYKDAFFQDLTVLRIERAEVYPAATDHIPEMIQLISTLLEKGVAYVGEDKSIYFSIARYPKYGQLARINPENLVAGARVKHDEYAKESVADFALWKAQDADDGDVAWDSPWGKGRPGWHIECSAMSMKYLGATFDIHTGGIDNLFPHHEDEIAQSEAATGQPLARYWLHCAHLMVDGEKMSKSLGNFYTLRDVLGRGFSGREIRWVLMSTHYRQSLNFTFQGCHDARAALQRIDDFCRRLAEVRTAPTAAAGDLAQHLAIAESEFRKGLEDDLNISASLAALFNLVRDVNRLLDAKGLAGSAVDQVLDTLRRFDQVLGVLDVGRETTAAPDDVQAMANERQAARKAKDFARADALRKALQERGWVVEDTPAGPRLKQLTQS